MPLETQHFYDFGDFRIDLAEKVLLRDGKFIPVTPKVFETLCVLVENAGRIIEKDELMQKIWQDRFVEESNLTFNIGMLRKALGDDASKPTYIETVPRRGYRFIHEVRHIETETNQSETINEPTVPLNGNYVASARFSHSLKQNGQRTGAVVAIADWRHEADTSEAVVSETSNGQLPKREFTSTSPLKNKRRNYLYLSAGLILTIAAIGFGWSLYHSIGATTQPPTVTVAKTARLTSSGNAKFAAVAPDGKFVAYILEENQQPGLWLKNVATGSSVEIVLPAETKYIGSIVFSPDGNYLYYNAKDALYQLPMLGGTPKKVFQNQRGAMQKYSNSITFSPDGKQFAFMRYSSEGEETADIVIADVDGTNERSLASSRRPNLFLRSAAWSPDGKTIVCAALNASGSQHIVDVRVADGAISFVPLPRWSFIGHLTWRPDGNSLLAIVSDESDLLWQIWSISYPDGKTRRITNDLNNYQSISLTADGSSIVAVRAEQEAHLSVVSADGTASRAKQLTGGFEKFDGVLGMNWTTDGKIIYDSAPSGKPEIWRVDADGRNQQRLADEAGTLGASPDGKYLVYQSIGDDGDTGLFRLNWSDGEKKRLTTGSDLDAAFSPDGKWVVFTRFDEDAALWKISIDGGEPVKLTNLPGMEHYPTVSPDGKYIAFIRYGTGKMSFPPMAVISSEGGEIVKEFDGLIGNPPGHGKVALQWTPDGQALDYAVHRDGVSNIWRQSLDGSPPVQLTNFESEQIFNFAAAPDGKQFALSRGKFSRDVILINNTE